MGGEGEAAIQYTAGGEQGIFYAKSARFSAGNHIACFAPKVKTADRPEASKIAEHALPQARTPLRIRAMASNSACSREASSARSRI